MKSLSYFKLIVLGFVCGALLLMLGFYTLLFRAPAFFPEGTIITVEEGDSLKAIADKLADAHIVRSRVWLTNFVLIVGRQEHVTEGDYYFPKSESVYSVAKRITSGDYKLASTKITIPEGSSVKDIADIIKSKFSRFDTRTFIALAKEKEGYLFPDTYFFMANTHPEEVVKKLEKTFEEKITSVRGNIEVFGESLEDVVTMASILEGEARQYETRQIVAGILWKRLEEGMPLQVDATFRYINGKTSEDLTLDDLKIDSPYNTYVYRGLPPTPISNPGLDSIKAAISPKKTVYYYFLTDKEGTMHYAKTLDEHAANKRKYLN
jgi:UPF0755 protein